MVREMSVLFTPSVAVCACQLSQISDVSINKYCMLLDKCNVPRCLLISDFFKVILEYYISCSVHLFSLDWIHSIFVLRWF